MRAIVDTVLQRYLHADFRAAAPVEVARLRATLLRSDPARRAAFLDKVAGPIANKMFECGMIP